MTALDALALHLSLWDRGGPDLLREVPAVVRAAFDAHDAAPPALDPGFDAHARFATERDGPAHARLAPPDALRTERYLRALERVRELARTAAALSPDGLAAVQGLVLGLPGERPAPLRTTSAFARGGAHVYPARDDLPAAWAARLRAWEDSPAHPAARAAGLYLDVIFLHPFADGNARAARLWSHFVLARAGRAAPEFAGVVTLPKAPGDVASFWRLARVVALSAARGTSCATRAIG